MFQQLDRDACLDAARPENDYYQRMLLSRDVSPEQIEKRYTELGRILHPDLDRERADLIDDAWELVREAYETLRFPEKRARYDSQPHRPTLEYGGLASVLAGDVALQEFEYGQPNSFSSPHLTRGRDDFLAEAQAAFYSHIPLDDAVENFSRIVSDGLRSNALSYDDFIHDRVLQGTIAVMVATLWRKYTWDVAVEKYRGSIEVLDATGAVDMEFVHKHSQSSVLDTARRIWVLYDCWELATEYYARFADSVTASGLITATQLHADETIQRSVVDHARSIFQLNTWQAAPEIYEKYLFACARSGVASSDSLNAFVAPFARKKALSIFDEHPWQNAPQIYQAFIQGCEKTGVLKRVEMARDNDLKARVSNVRRQLAALYNGEGLLFSFDTACSLAGIVPG